MDTGYTYSTGRGLKVTIYAPTGVTPPDRLTLPVSGTDTTFHRISDNDLTCHPLPGERTSCGSYECHRRTLGECDCKRHPAPVPFRPVT
ncbi:hypothetical protein AS850_02910 [Frondihabitans sp. 762G35]|uniref:hypothetical protein n=1 Tax=Frondihabitans sp. 762G35 TaxID=1446794 RepID=UPI000D2209DB|nr:hypothetical protein [Frondihabitans sp. 762G35]ARC56023.1 hypothetical protein AS850_02910 [Frondihabitans sp. 762G35]